MKPEQLKEMNEIQWWHSIMLDGVITPGRDNSQAKLQTIQMPNNLKGKSVIDVGAWDGFFSFEAERRNAESVLAIDTVMWKEAPTFDVQKNIEVMHTGKKGFNFAHKILNSKVKSEEIEVMNLPYLKTMKGYETTKFDLVLCLGILYHMKDPFGMCKVMYDITKEGGMCILETHMDLFDIQRPVMAFYPNKECNNDPGTWWGPNPQCVAKMLKSVGFNEVKMVFSDKRINRGVFHAHKSKPIKAGGDTYVK